MHAKDISSGICYKIMRCDLQVERFIEVLSLVRHLMHNFFVKNTKKMHFGKKSKAANV